MSFRAYRTRSTLVFGSLALLVSAAAVRDVPAEEVKPIKALLVLGGCCHDYEKQKDLLAEGISARAHVEVTISYSPDKTTKVLNPVYERPDWANGFDVVIHDECTSDVKNVDIINRILEPHRQGLPGVVLHCGMHCYRSEGYPDSITPWFAFTGLQSTGHGPQSPIAVSLIDSASPITQGFGDWTTVKEELYNNLKVFPTAHPLIRGKQVVKRRDGTEKTEDFVVAWANEFGKARVFSTTLGHNNVTVGDARYLDLVTRGLLWSCGKLAADGKPVAGYEAVKQ